MTQSFFKKIKKHALGFTMVETIFYLAFLIVLLAIVITLVVNLAKTYQNIQATKNLESSAVFSLERMTRDIRNAISASVTADTLTLNTADASNAPQLLKFYISNTSGALSVDSNNIYVGPLTLSGVTVNELQFQLATSTNSQAVKVSLGLTSVVGGASTTKNFYDTIVLRGSY